MKKSLILLSVILIIIGGCKKIEVSKYPTPYDNGGKWRVIKVTVDELDNYLAEYTYDSLGNLLASKKNSGEVGSWTAYSSYKSVDGLIAESFEVNDTVEYIYDENRKLIEVDSPKDCENTDRCSIREYTYREDSTISLMGTYWKNGGDLEQYYQDYKVYEGGYISYGTASAPYDEMYVSRWIDFRELGYLGLFPKDNVYLLTGLSYGKAATEGPSYFTYRSRTVTKGSGNRPLTYVQRAWGYPDSLDMYNYTHTYQIEWKNFEK